MATEYDFGFLHRNICIELNELFEKKNHDYGDSFHDGFSEYGLVMSAVRLGDKFRRFNKLVKEPSHIKDESIRDTLVDLANYAIMTIIELDIQETESNHEKSN